MLTPPAKAHLAKRVCVVGAESSGTTTLARALARHYQTAWVPEYGRHYYEGRQHATPFDRWHSREFHLIARRQAAWEEDLAQHANKLLISDTDPLATSVWHRRYLGQQDPELEAFAQGRRYDLYLLTRPDFPFAQDGTRQDGPHRQQMHSWLLEALERQPAPHLVLAGPRDDRLRQATETIDELLHFAPLSDPTLPLREPVT